MSNSLMKNFSICAFIALVLCSCSAEQGDNVGVKAKTKWFSEKPYGMTLIPGGSFTMGSQDEDISGSLSAPKKTVTVRSYYMDETEVTNSEYKEFVHWVRDSIIRFKLAEYSELMSPAEGVVLDDYQFKNADTTRMNAYERYMIKTYGSIDGDLDSPSFGKSLNWDSKLHLDPNSFPSEEYAEVMADSIFISSEDSFNGKRMIDIKKLKYSYERFDKESAARSNGPRRNYIKSEMVEIYPDTTVWIKDFNYSYNDPMHQDYFYHDAYGDYPVVGVSWKQAKAYCSWRTKIKNDFLRSKKKASQVSSFRLASEAEWEYAARGGLEYATYPWGGPYTTTERGCFLANFKPQRGNYAVDGALYTVEAKSYDPNGYGLYNMAGNVSEWTNTAYNESSYYLGSTMNPNVANNENKRKIIRGGSWKDVAYFLQVSTRDYEYADSARSYIGFRAVQNHLGTSINGK